MPESIKMKFFHCFSTDKTASMESFARLLIAIPLVSYVLAVLSLWVGLQINSFIFPIAVCISVLWECSDRRIRGCVRWTTTVAVLVVLSVTLGLSACIYDRSFDGQWYHACTIRELVNGWNPIYSSACSPTPIDGYTVLWVEHYPRGIETIAATIVPCMGNLDAGKALNLWFVFSSIVYIYLFLCYCLPTMNKYLRIWIALVVALNPVVINQMCTYYIDWTLYTLLVIFLINMYLFFVKGIQRTLHIDLLLLFFIPAIKFNIFFWVVLWGGICFFALLRKSRCKHSFRLTAVCAVVVLLGIGVGAYNPYLTNWKEHGSPVYPLSGNGKVDIMDCQVLPAILPTICCPKTYMCSGFLKSTYYHRSHLMFESEDSVYSFSKRFCCLSFCSFVRGIFVVCVGICRFLSGCSSHWLFFRRGGGLDMSPFSIYSRSLCCFMPNGSG